MSNLQKSILKSAAIVVFLSLFFIFVLWRFSPIPAKGLDVGPSEFSSERALILLSEILAEEVPHPTGSEANAIVRDRIIAQFEFIGFQAEIQQANNCEGGECVDIENIIAVLPGKTGTAEIDQPAVMVVTHYDSVPEGPGAADAGASVAIVLETARILGEEGPFDNPIIFMLTDAEEIELNGAAAFVEEHRFAQHVGVIINLEARGTSGASLMFETSDGDSWLIQEFIKVAPRPSLSSLFFEVYKALPNDTDLTIFKRAGMAGYGFAFIGSVENYHTPNDNLANLDRNTLQHQGENGLKLARHMANSDLTQVKGENFIYTDIMSMFVIRYRIPVGQVMAIALVNGLIGLAGLFYWKGWVTAKKIAIGFASAIVVLVGSLLLLAIPPNLWDVIPFSKLLITLVIILITYFVGSFLALRATVLDVSVGVWLFWTVLTLAFVFTLPGASIIFFIPAACAAILHIILLWKKESQPMVLFLSMVAAAAVWLKLVNLFDVALTIEVGQAIIAFPLGVLATAVLPLLTTPAD